MLDIFVATVCIALLSPFLACIAVGVRLSSPGPAIFRQYRVGREGRPFCLFKFRSMPASTGDVASDRLGAIDIGRFGRFIRRTNLDELPQLVNILRGDMSLVGPRPPLPSQLELIEMRKDNGALSCRPGLTGLAQVNSFDGMSVSEKAAYDGQYAAKISFGGDVAIVLKTFIYLLTPPPIY